MAQKTQELKDNPPVSPHKMGGDGLREMITAEETKGQQLGGQLKLLSERIRQTIDALRVSEGRLQGLKDAEELTRMRKN